MILIMFLFIYSVLGVACELNYDMYVEIRGPIAEVSSLHFVGPKDEARSSDWQPVSHQSLTLSIKVSLHTFANIIPSLSSGFLLLFFPPTSPSLFPSPPYSSAYINLKT